MKTQKKISDRDVNRALLKLWRSQSPDDEPITMKYGHSVQQVRRAFVRIGFVFCEIEGALRANDHRLLRRALSRLERIRVCRSECDALSVDDLLLDAHEIAEALEAREA